MAHEVENMMYVGQTPWHGLGIQLPHAPTIEEAIVAAGLDWSVSKRQNMAGEIIVPSFTTFRDSDNSILGTVKEDYEVLQNIEAFRFFQRFLDEKACTLETAGSLRAGTRVFILAKIKSDPLTIVKNDLVEKYILLSNSHDGSLAIRVGFTPIRVVCANTLRMSINSKASKLIKIKHTKNAKQTLATVGEIMNVANHEFEATAEQYRFLASKQVSGDDLKKLVKIVFKTAKEEEQQFQPQTEEDKAKAEAEENECKRIVTRVIPLFEKGRGNDLPGVKGTYWAAYNAVNEYLGYERGKDREVRLDNLWFGQGAVLNQKALKAAVTLAKAA